MKKALVVAALLALMAFPALSADLPVAPGAPYGASAPVLIPNYWAACYAGGGGGYGLWNQDITVLTDPGFVQENVKTTAGGRGWFGTLQVGCDAQISGRFVVGLFADWDFSDVAGTALVGYPVNFPDNATVREHQNWAWAIGGRVGYIVWPQLLVYVSGGFTEAHFNRVELADQIDGLAIGSHIPGHTYQGWFFGTGYEYALGWVPGLFWKTEYRYSGFESVNLSVLDDATGLTTGNAIHSHKFAQAIRSELVWRFNWGGAVGRIRW
jgi:outer membrane immunogenic protein